MKWRKPLSALLSACLLLSCTSCSFVENYFGVTQEEKQLQQEKESQVSALSSALEPGNMKKLGEPITCNWSTWQDDGTTLKNTLEVTVTGAQIFENFEDAGIPVEETHTGSLNKVLNTDKYTLPETPFVLVDVTIKKRKELPREKLWKMAFSVRCLACTAGNSWNGVKNMRGMLSCESLNISAVMKSKIQRVTDIHIFGWIWEKNKTTRSASS